MVAEIHDSPYILIDANYLCHRAFVTTGGLHWKGGPTGVLFGVLRDVVMLIQRFETDQLVFLFDQGQSVRTELFPGYKWKRRQARQSQTPEEKKWWDGYYEQVNKLRTEQLKELGFNKMFSHDGFEADDLIGRCVQLLAPKDHEIVIVSADKDMYQFLDDADVFHPDPERLYTAKNFHKDYGVPVDKWVFVKAMAGCTSDSIPGVPGVGETTALKYLKDQLPSHHKRFKALAEGAEIIDRNLCLVRLPHPRTPEISLKKKNKVTTRTWKDFCKKYGMRSLASDCPF